MTKQSRRTVIIGFLLAIAILLSVIRSQRSQNGLHYKTFCAKNGWGYDVFIENRVLIHQDVVPVINTQQGFKYERQAEKAARLVIKKIRMKKLPQLTKSEIQLLLSSNEAY
jgi:hypothetical protein